MNQKMNPATMRNSLGRQILYRPMTAADLPAAHQLSLNVGWPHRREDWQFIEALGPGFVAEDSAGLIGTAMYWKHDPRFASLGMVIVAPTHQGRGIGKQLMTMVLEQLQGMSVMLHATDVGKPMYERFGFRAVGEIHQHQGVVRQRPSAALVGRGRLRPIGASDDKRLSELASRVAGFSRQILIPELLKVAEGIVLDEQGKPVGFALMRRFGRGVAIGPVIAPNLDSAKVLISHWLSALPRKFVRLDVPHSAGLTDWLAKQGLVHVSSVVPMWRGAAPSISRQPESFALISQALG